MFQKFFKKFQKDPAPECYLGLDIGTEFVKALVFTVNDHKVHIRGVGKKRQKLGDMHGGAITDIGGVIHNCRKAIDDAEYMAGMKVKQAVVGIAGELVKGSTSRVHYDRNNPKEKITLQELKNIVHRVQWKSFDQVRSQLAWETGYPEIDVRLVNAAVVDVTIDGYRISNPIGFQGKDVEVSIFNAFAPLVHLGAIQTVCDELHIDLLALSAEPYAVAKAVRQDDANFSGIFIDIGGGTTDIAVVRDGGVEGTKMFALGGRSFTKRLSQVLNVSFTEAENVKLAYSKDRLDRASRLKVKNSLENDVDIWLSGIEVTLSDFYNIDLLPSKIYLCGGGAGLPEIKKALESNKWPDDVPFARKPRISIIDPKMITNVEDHTGILRSHEYITSMGLCSLLVDIESDNDLIVSKILQKVVKLMHT